VIPIPEYWEAVARSIDAENQKANIFITHNDSLGVAREAILRDLLVKQTPEPYRVSTGFVYYAEAKPKPWSSKQCDVLVYDPTASQPYYSIGGLSVVPRRACKLIIEVKTRLKQETFKQILGVWGSTFWLNVPTLGFAFEGETFKSFLEYVVEAIKSEDRGVPECLAVHRDNYLMARSSYRLATNPETPNRHRPAKYHFAVNFGITNKKDGRASAAFLDFYDRLLRNGLGQIDENHLYTWFSRLELPKEGLVRISNEGEVIYGPIPKDA